MASVRCVTLNILGPGNPDWERRRGVIAAALQDLNPDIVTLQEVRPEDVPSLVGPGYTVTAFSQRSDDRVTAVIATRSVCYQDCWETVHPHDPGFTFTSENPLVREGQVFTAVSRRIDYILVRAGWHGPLFEVADARRVLDAPVNGVWASDHCGLFAELQLPSHPPGEWAADNVLNATAGQVTSKKSGR